jgi:hypothetical protein
MNIASRGILAIAQTTLHETVVFDRDAGPDGASWLQKSAFEVGATRWKDTKYVLPDVKPVMVLMCGVSDSCSSGRTTSNDSNDRSQTRMDG